MEQFASETATLLLFTSPLLIFAKIVHGLATRRVSLAPRGSRGVKAELTGWLLLAALDAHTLALWSAFSYEPESLCARYRPGSASGAYLTDGRFFEYPVQLRCVWPDGGSVNVVPWPLNVATALFAAAALAVVAHAAVRAYRLRTRHTLGDTQR
ncbi:hypothetical protein [Amycolatopsis aidingensis]|uniref:hypothetical protein n=1 Tax=Amycolatopsis aidingensis TaxID=2842453 RepID=UPI001C0DF90A|nr:hypothetical protein [Amycolatopsis aidingensis]